MNGDPAPTQARGGATVTLLGSAGWIPAAGREGCCAAVRADDHLLVIDAGTGLRRLMDAGRLDGVSRVDLVLTHFHLDHVAGLGYLPALGELDISIHGPGLALYGVPTKTILEPFFSPPYLRTDRDRWLGAVRDIEPPELQLDPARLLVRAQERHSDPSLGIRGERFAYCTDTAFDPGNNELAQGADVLFHEAWCTAEGEGPGDAHTSAAEAAELAARAEVGELVLIHLPPMSEEERQAVLDEARARFPRTVLGSDGASWDLAREDSAS